MPNLLQQTLGLCVFRIPLLSDFNLPALTFTAYRRSRHTLREKQKDPPQNVPLKNIVPPTEFLIQFRKQVKDVGFYSAERMCIEKRQFSIFFFLISNVPQKPACKCGMTIHCVTRYLFSPSSPDSALTASHCCPSVRVQKGGRREEKRNRNGGLERWRKQQKAKARRISILVKLQVQTAADSSLHATGRGDVKAVMWKRWSRLFLSVMHQSTQEHHLQKNTAWIISNHYTHTHAGHASIIIWRLLELVLYS